jgi:hypothetical protein
VELGKKVRQRLPACFTLARILPTRKYNTAKHPTHPSRILSTHPTAKNRTPQNP